MAPIFAELSKSISFISSCCFTVEFCCLLVGCVALLDEEEDEDLLLNKLLSRLVFPGGGLLLPDSAELISASF